MGRSLNPVDACALMNLVVKEALGANAEIQTVSTANFASVGETLLASGTENVLNALSRVLGRTFMAVRPYDAKLKLINSVNTEMYTDRMRKISFYAKDAQNSGWFNTDSYVQHASGLDNGVNRVVNGSISPIGGLGNMWEQNQPVPLELNFAGRDVWDDSITIYENQLKVAFRGPEEFGQFAAGFMTEKGNDIESQKEAFNRSIILQQIGMTYDMNQTGQRFDLKAGFNTKFGTNYTSAQLRTTYLKEFLAYAVAQMKIVSDQMTLRTKKFHWSPSKTVNGVSYSLVRHTPKSRQRCLLYQPLLYDAEAQIFSQIFNPQYLDVGQYEGVDFWQNINDPSAVKITPAIPNTSDPTEQTTGSTVALDYVVGLLYDEDAMMVDYQMDSAYTTPIEARKGYHNIWYHFSKNMINDPTENCVLFYMGNDV